MWSRGALTTEDVEVLYAKKLFVNEVAGVLLVPGY